MRTIAIGDIHGGLKGLIQALNRVEVRDEDTLIFMGDYMDGWSEAAQTVQFLIDLSKKFNCIFIKGNHDVSCEEWLETGEVKAKWFMHGGKETMESYQGFSDQEKAVHLQFLKDTHIYYLDEQNRLFLHAGFTSQKGIKEEPLEENFYKDRTLWEMAVVMDKSIDKDSLLYPKRLKNYKEIYIGHTPTTNFEQDKPMNVANVWNIDTGAAFTGKVTAMNIDTKEYVQSDALPSLYPNEKGRNK